MKKFLTNNKYVLPEKSAKKDFLFNMIGSTASAAVSVILLILASRITGDSGAGVFSLCYPTAQMMYIVAVFEMRNIQVTDAKGEFSFGDILAYRIISCAFMLLLSIVFVVIKGFDFTTATVCLLFCGYMVALAFSDAFQGNAHLNGYLQISGFSLTISVILAMVAFAATLFFTKSLVASVVPMIIVVLLWILIYDIPRSRAIGSIKPIFNFNTQKDIFLCAAPLVISNFFHQYSFNAPKYAIDSILTKIEQAHYGYLIMPAFFINLLSIFVFRPQMVELSQKWQSHQLNGFLKTVARLLICVLGFTVFALACGYTIGIPVLEYMYNAELSYGKNMLLLLLLAGGVGALCSLISTLITIARKQIWLIVSYTATFAISMFLPDMLTRALGMKGAVLSYLYEMLFLLLIMSATFLIILLKEKRCLKGE